MHLPHSKNHRSMMHLPHGNDHLSDTSQTWDASHHRLNSETLCTNRTIIAASIRTPFVGTLSPWSGVLTLEQSLTSSNLNTRCRLENRSIWHTYRPSVVPAAGRWSDSWAGVKFRLGLVTVQVPGRGKSVYSHDRRG
jgi:hypothetical protein